MPITRLYDFVTGNIANPDEVDAEFNQIVSIVNALESSQMPKSGGIFTGAVTFNTNASFAAGTLTLFADPASAMQAATKQYVDAQAALKLALAGGILTGDLTMKYAQPTIYMRSDSAEDQADWAIQAVGDATKRLLFYYNTGTIAAPTWELRYSLEPDGLLSLDQSIVTQASLNIRIPSAKTYVVKEDGDFSTTSTTFVDVTGLTGNITLGTDRFVRIGVNAHIENGSGFSKTVYANVQVDGVDLHGTDGVFKTSIGANAVEHLSLNLRTTAQLAAGAHTIKVQIKGSSGTTILVANATQKAALYLEEAEY